MKDIIQKVEAGVDAVSRVQVIKGKMREEITRHTAKEKRLCPFIDEPFDDCYIKNMISLNTEAVINYCGGNFEECPIYKRHAKAK